MSPLLAHYNTFQGADAVGFTLVMVCVDIYCCGLLSTRKSDCTGLPASMLRNPEGPQQRGQSHIRMKGNMSLISWYNKGNFRFLSNAYSPIKQGMDSGSETNRAYRELMKFKALMILTGQGGETHKQSTDPLLCCAVTSVPNWLLCYTVTCFS